jgi:hypothetical protein
LSKLTAAPFSLLKGYGVYIKVIATNAYGDSSISPVGNGGLIVFVSNAPILLLNDPSVTTNAVIGFTWSDPANDGDSDIIDHRITYDQSIGNFVVLQTGVFINSYTTSVSISSGQTYIFMVEARNSVGYSAYSAEISILAA